MSGIELVVLFVAALMTAALTAVAGAGGGMILLIVILQFVDPLVAIPAHGVIQLFSNGTRAMTLRRDVDRSLLAPFVVPLIPFTIAGYFVADAIPRTSGRAVIGCFALLAVWWPAATAWLAPKPGRGSRFALVGALSGFVNPTVGAAGPLLAPAFRTAARDHVAFVGTFSVAQLLSHIVKVAVFAVAGYAWADNLGMIAVGAVGVVAGTRMGSQWLRRFDPATLTRLFKIAVTAGAVRLIFGWIA
ncbi:MAG: sulfite exporter TauE/SafE family protein [Actinomycetota bacterium]